MKINKTFPLVFLISLMGLNSITNAAQTTTNLQTTAQLQAACRFSIPDFTFGNVSYKSDKFFMNTLTVTCNKNVNAIASINQGVSGSFTRYMTNGSPDSDHLRYWIFIPGDNKVLGDGTDGTSRLSIIGTGAPVNHFISGIIYRNQYVSPGNYSDNLTMTLTY